jgi:hypothetical protein
MCGVRSVLGDCIKGWSAGSGSKTSRAAPASRLSASAWARASESTTPPREVRCERCLSWVQKGLYSRDQLRVDCSYTVVF